MRGEETLQKLLGRGESARLLEEIALFCLFLSKKRMVLWFCFLLLLLKHPDESNLEEKGFIPAHDSRLHFIVVGKLMQKELEAAAGQEQREGAHACLCSALSLYSSAGQGPTHGMVLLAIVNAVKANLHRHVHRPPDPEVSH